MSRRSTQDATLRCHLDPVASYPGALSLCTIIAHIIQVCVADDTVRDLTDPWYGTFQGGGSLQPSKLLIAVEITVLSGVFQRQKIGRLSWNSSVLIIEAVLA